VPGMDADVFAAFIDPLQRSARGRVADRCVQSHGSAGYLAEYEAERFYRNVRIYRIYEGTTQILQLQIAKHMLRDYPSGA
jgi:acyl-CoA dehydrogenase